jgi:hypothetical protein
MEIDTASMAAAVAPASVARQSLGAQTVSTTLDYMHAQKNCSGSCDYTFQKDVLSAHTGKGTIINVLA